MLRVRYIKFLVKLAVGFLIFAFLIWKIGPNEILIHITQFELSYVVFVILIYPVTFVAGGVGIVLLGRSISGRLKWWEGIKGFLGTISLAIFVPGRLGDFSLPFYWKDSLSYGESLGVLLIDKIVTLTWVLGLGSCAIYAILDKAWGVSIGIISLSSLGLFLLIFSMEKFRSFFYRCLPQKFFDLFQGSINALKLVVKKGKKALLMAFIITGFRLSLYGVIFWILLLSLDISCPIYYPIFILAIAQLVSLLPVSIMGLGTAEMVYIFAFAKINIDAGPIIAVSLLGRVMTLFWLGLFFTLFAIKSKTPHPLKDAELVP